MAVIVLAILSFALLGVVVLQYRASHTLRSDLRYIADKLQEITAERSTQRLLHRTDTQELRRLLQGINRLQEQHQLASVEYARTELAMRRMLSNISHDLRTPLTVISGYVEMLQQRPDLSAADRATLSKISDKAQEVIEMMNTFFDLAKLESGDQEVPLSRVQLNEVCRRSILTFYDVLTENGFEVAITIPDAPIYAYANEEALDRVLNNLISNAIQHGADGRMLGLTLRADAEVAYVEVTDRGKGILEHHQDHIFERLYTLDDSRNRRYQGSGLGLTITKRLIERMQGTITVTSRPYEQTTFSVRLKRLSFGLPQT